MEHVAYCCNYSNEPSCSITLGEFLDQMRNYQLLKGSTPCSDPFNAFTTHLQTETLCVLNIEYQLHNQHFLCHHKQVRKYMHMTICAVVPLCSITSRTVRLN